MVARPRRSDSIRGPPGSAARPPDTLVRDVTWEQVTSDRAAVHGAPVTRALWILGALDIERVRPTSPSPAARRSRLPAPRPDHRRRSGHPPAGSTGPTGLYEGVATLAIAQQLEKILIAHGAAVIDDADHRGPAWPSRPGQ